MSINLDFIRNKYEELSNAGEVFLFTEEDAKYLSNLLANKGIEHELIEGTTTIITAIVDGFVIKLNNVPQYTMEDHLERFFRNELGHLPSWDDEIDT